MKKQTKTPKAKGAAKVRPPAKKPAKAAKDATASKKTNTAKRGGDGAKRPSGLDAAAKVLAEADGPLGCKEIIERALAKDYWKTKGATPAATIYAAMTREIAANGDAANKIGTYGLAVLAKYHKVPFYIAAPSSTIDPSISNGKEIIIEERSGAEVREIFGVKIAPEDCPAISPAFDVTPNSLITAIITEQQVFRPPYYFK